MNRLTHVLTYDGGVLVAQLSQVFDADEATQLFVSFYETGDIPPGYELQPIEGYREDGSVVNLGR